MIMKNNFFKTLVAIRYNDRGAASRGINFKVDWKIQSYIASRMDLYISSYGLPCASPRGI